MAENFKFQKERHRVCEKKVSAVSVSNIKIQDTLSSIFSDGEFYMSFEDFAKYFQEIEFVNLSPMRMRINKTRMARTYNMISVRAKGLQEVNAKGKNTKPECR